MTRSGSQRLRNVVLIVLFVTAPLAAASLVQLAAHRLWLMPECRERCAAIGQATLGPVPTGKGGPHGGCVCSNGSRVAWSGPDGISDAMIAVYLATYLSAILILRLRANRRNRLQHGRSK